MLDLLLLILINVSGVHNVVQPSVADLESLPCQDRYSRTEVYWREYEEGAPVTNLTDYPTVVIVPGDVVTETETTLWIGAEHPGRRELVNQFFVKQACVKPLPHKMYLPVVVQ